MPERAEIERLPDCEHGYFAAGGTDTCPACDADALDYLEQRKAEAARSPQGEGHEAGIEAAWVCPTCGGTNGHFLGCGARPAALDRVREDHETEAVAALYEFAQKRWGWGSEEYESVRDAVAVVLSRVSPSRDGTVAVEDVIAALRRYDDDLTPGTDWFDAVGEHPADLIERVFSRPAQPEPDALGGQNADGG